MSKKETAVQNGEPKITIWHKMFGSKPGDGELQPKEGFSFSLAGFGQNLICTIVGSYLTVFMTDAIGYPALWVALLMLFARLFDAANDPIMGSIVDSTRTPWGKCRPYLKWMPIPIAIMTILCFLPFYARAGQAGGFAAISIVYIMWSVVYTICDVPYWGLSTAMSNDTNRRGNLLTIARLICTLGAGIVTIVVPQITSNVTFDNANIVNVYQDLITGIHQSGYNLDVNSLSDLPSIQAYIASISPTASWDINALQLSNDANLTGVIGQDLGILYQRVIDISEGTPILTGANLQDAVNNAREVVQGQLQWIYFIAAIACCVVAVPLFYVGYANTKERNQSLETPPSLGHNLKLLFKNKPLMLIVLSGVLGAARMAFTYTGGLYFAKYVLAGVEFAGMKGEGLYTIMTLAIVPGGLVASLMVPYLTKKIGKRHSYIWSHIIGGAVLLIAFILGITIDKGHYTNPIILIIALNAIIISGIPSGLSNILSYAMIGDTVEYLELKTGERAEGICFAMQTFISKIGMAVGAFIGVLGYYMAGVTPNNPGALDAGGKDTMWIMLMLVAAVSFIASAIPFFFYKFNEKEQQEAVAEIKRRKEAAGLGGENVENLELAEEGFAPETVEFPNEDAVAVPPTEDTPAEEAPKDEE